VSVCIPGSSDAKIVLPGMEPASNACGYNSQISRRVTAASDKGSTVPGFRIKHDRDERLGIMDVLNFRHEGEKTLVSDSLLQQ